MEVSKINQIQAAILHLLLDYTDHPSDVADPWYTDDFEATWQDVLAGGVRDC